MPPLSPLRVLLLLALTSAINATPMQAEVERSSALRGQWGMLGLPAALAAFIVVDNILLCFVFLAARSICILHLIEPATPPPPPSSPCAVSNASVNQHIPVPLCPLPFVADFNSSSALGLICSLPKGVNQQMARQTIHTHTQTHSYSLTHTLSLSHTHPVHIISFSI